MLRPKLVYYWSTSFGAISLLLFLLLRASETRCLYTSTIPEVMGYEPLYNNLIGPCEQNTLKNQLHKNVYKTYNERDSLTSRHKISLDELTCR